MKKIICTLLVFAFSFTIFSSTLMVHAGAENMGSESLIEDIEKDENEEENQVMSSGSSGGGNNNGETWYNLQVINGVPQLPHAVDYSVEEGLLKYVKSGDLIYEDAGGYDITGHSAIVYDILYSTEYQQYYVVTIEAGLNSGVAYGLFTPTRFIEKECEITRLTDATDEQIENAVSWAKAQIGKSYLLLPTKNPDPDNANWYCSELIWAAFYSQGIYLDADDNNPFGTAVTPRELNNYENAPLIMHYQHNTVCVDNANGTHTLTCNNEVFTEAHEIEELNCCYDNCKVCGYRTQISPHDYTHRYVSQSSTAHYAYCECGNSILQSHNFTETATHKLCTECGYRVAINHTHSYIYRPNNNGRTHRKICTCGDSSLEACLGMKQNDGKSYCIKCGQEVGGTLLLSTEDEEMAKLIEKFGFYVDLHA